MKDKQYYVIASTIFAIVAIAHLARIFFVLDATIGGYSIPLWVSGVAVVLAGYLATRGIMAARRL